MNGAISARQRAAIDADMLVLRTLSETKGATAFWLAGWLSMERREVSYRLGRLRKLGAAEHWQLCVWKATAAGRALLDFASASPSPVSSEGERS